MVDEGLSVQCTDANHAYLPLGNGYYLRGSSYSQYQGVFLRRDGSFFKYIDELRFNVVVRHVSRSGNDVTLHTDKGKIVIRSTSYGLQISTSTTLPVELLLDMRFIHDYDDAGRIYDVTDDNHTALISYTKYETDRCETEDYEAQLGVDASDWSTEMSWEKKIYSYDQMRGTKASHWVFNAGRLTIKPDHPCRLHLPSKPLADSTLSSYRYEEDSKTRLAAGYPWFFQAWSRDEIISLAPLIDDNPSLAKDFVVNAARRGQGEQSVAGSDLASADTPGWLARRTQQLLRSNISFDDEERSAIGRYFTDYVDTVETVSSLVVNDSLETWMDTSGGTGDVRRGCRVEIQAGYLCILDVLTTLTGEQIYADLYREVKRSVRKHLVEDGVLRDGWCDGEVDMTTRPNVFLAYYLHGDMVPASTWHETFEHVLDKCWLEWGGLSSIATDHPLFIEHHTGMDNRSYHRGDSWYYVNNIAAIALDDIGRHRYLKYVERIRDASIRDYESLGAIGASSEISDADEQRSRGTFAQAWSEATLIELRRRV